MAAIAHEGPWPKLVSGLGPQLGWVRWVPCKAGQSPKGLNWWSHQKGMLGLTQAPFLHTSIGALMG